jgi:hypothetical protein
LTGGTEVPLGHDRERDGAGDRGQSALAGCPGQTLAERAIVVPVNEPRAAACRRVDLVPPGPAQVGPRHTVRTLEGTRQLIGSEHAMAGEETLCGVPRAEVEVLRRVWRSDSEIACPACTAADRTAKQLPEKS